MNAWILGMQKTMTCMKICKYGQSVIQMGKQLQFKCVQLGQKKDFKYHNCVLCYVILYTFNNINLS